MKIIPLQITSSWYYEHTHDQEQVATQTYELETLAPLNIQTVQLREK
jgi:hypothetical protein